MGDRVGRNDPCPCGSGKKYKHCCIGKEADEQAASTRAMWIVLGLCVLAGAAITIHTFAQQGLDSGAKRVWSEAHGHWHIEGEDHEASVAPIPLAQPPGRPPAGKVWSAEHGHWHDAP